MGGEYNPYPAYKDSGDILLESVPEHWQLTRVKYVAEIMPKKPRVDLSLECSFVPMEKLKNNSIVLDEIKQVESVYDGYTYFSDGDILMAKVTPCFENKNIAIASGLTNKIGFGSSEIYIIRAGKNVDNRFLYYRFQEDGFIGLAIGAMTGAGGLKRVPSEAVSNYIYASPGKDEQQNIANFLDHETAKIDTLIEKQQQLIKLLKEKRQAVISHAVTKGLNPNAPMRDSGVEWLGEVPEHWILSKVKYEYENLDGRRIPLSTLERSSMQGEFPYYGASGVIDHVDSFIFHEDLVLVSEDGANLLMRSYPIAFPAYGKYWVNNHAHILRPKDQKVEFWSEVIEVRDLTPYVSGSAQPKFTSEALSNLQIAVPPHENEVNEIAAYIKQQKEKYAFLINKAGQSIKLMHERRTALISAAVTGEIDVRNWKEASNG